MYPTISELNAHLKKEKSQRKSSKQVEAAERNAQLIIGGRGCWNGVFQSTLLKEFALINSYVVTSFVDLLRLIRNILEHSHENPNAMLAQFGIKQPGPEEIFQHFFTVLPFFYLQSSVCYHKFLENRSDNTSKIYMTTYEKYCYFLMAQCLEKGELLPMRQYSFVNVQFHSIVTEISQEVKKPVPRTVLSMMDILPSIIETITVTWPSFPLEQIAITYEGELIQNPFATCLKTSSSVAEIVLDINDNERVLEKIRFLDGASVHFHKPELQILLDDNPEVNAVTSHV